MTEKNKKSKFQTIILVALTSVLTGGFIGATTNMINGAVSPYYFKAVMSWDFKDIWTASVIQGGIEGLLYGIIFALIFMPGFGVVTEGEASYRFACRQLLKIMAIVFSCWIIGGVLAMFLATLSPDFYKAHFPYTPMERREMLRFAWVGGSIWGGVIGGFLTAIFGVVVIKNSWVKEMAKKRK